MKKITNTALKCVCVCVQMEETLNSGVRMMLVFVLMLCSCVSSTRLHNSHSCSSQQHNPDSQTSHLFSQHHGIESRAHLDGTERSARMQRSVRQRKGSACALRRVLLRVSDLGLGFKSQEEFMYTYCSGVCANSRTNYDKIIASLAANRRTRLIQSPPTACCRPIEYDDDLSFLDDHLIYHTVEKHSARKCGCV